MERSSTPALAAQAEQASVYWDSGSVPRARASSSATHEIIAVADWLDSQSAAADPNRVCLLLRATDWGRS